MVLEPLTNLKSVLLFQLVHHLYVTDDSRLGLQAPLHNGWHCWGKKGYFSLFFPQISWKKHLLLPLKLNACWSMVVILFLWRYSKRTWVRPCATCCR